MQAAQARFRARRQRVPQPSAACAPAAHSRAVPPPSSRRTIRQCLTEHERLLPPIGKTGDPPPRQLDPAAEKSWSVPIVVMRALNAQSWSVPYSFAVSSVGSPSRYFRSLSPPQAFENGLYLSFRDGSGPRMDLRPRMMKLPPLVMSWPWLSN